MVNIARGLVRIAYCLATLATLSACKTEYSQLATLKVHYPFNVVTEKGQVIAVPVTDGMPVKLIIASDKKKGRGLVIEQQGVDKKRKLILPFQVDPAFNLYHADVGHSLTKQNIGIVVRSQDLDQDGPSTREEVRPCSISVNQHVCIRDRFGEMECNYRTIETSGSKLVDVTSDWHETLHTLTFTHENGAVVAEAAFTVNTNDESVVTVRSCDAVPADSQIIVDDFTRDIAAERRERERLERERRIQEEIRERDRRERKERERLAREAAANAGVVAPQIP